MALKDSVKNMLLTNPHPKKIRRGAAFTIVQTWFTPKSRFRSGSEKRLVLHGYNHVRKFFQGGKRAVFTSLFAPTELVYAFGCLPFSLEVIAAAAASMDLAPELLAETEKNYLSTDLCSFHRAYMGLSRFGLLPRPAFMLATSQTCDGTFKSFDDVSSLFESPLLFLNTPYHCTKESVAYLAQQLEAAKGRIEEITSTKLEMENLERAFFYSNRARSALQEINELRTWHAPLLYGGEGFGFVFTGGNLIGSKPGELVFEGYCKELKKRKKSEIPAIKGKKRILWLHLKPFYPNRLVNVLEEDLGAAIIAEEINSVYWDELDIRNPWESLARKLMSNFWAGGTERRLANIRRMIQSYGIDGVIHFAHWGCRQSNGAVRLMKDTVGEYGIPFLNLDGDCIDGRNYSEGQLMTRLEGFMEVLG
jgi:benzoyl-CoA reductase/2-hydroxyglutaryl-CoA dehydratase subunit BcrC/BadD/HgdB